jgi:hypothetical protein
MNKLLLAQIIIRTIELITCIHIIAGVWKHWN